VALMPTMLILEFILSDTHFTKKLIITKFETVL